MTRERVVLQLIAQTPEEVSIPEVDLLIGAATWDRRCLAISSVSLPDSISHVLLLKFANRGTSGRVDSHEATLFQRLSRVAANRVALLDVDSRHLVESWLAFRQTVLDIYESVGRPLRIAIDLNSVPRYLALSLMGFGARTGIVERYTAMYAAARSYEGEAAQPIAFTEGSWRPRAIPTLGEGAAPSARSVLVISGGFEGDHTLRLVGALEPDRVMVALSAGIRPEHDQTARRASVGLAEEYLIGEGGVITLPANDVAESIAALNEALSELRSDDLHSLAVSFLLCGTKIAALAMGMYAIDHPVAQVYYAEPERRLESSAAEIEWYTAVTIAL